MGASKTCLNLQFLWANSCVGSFPVYLINGQACICFLTKMKRRPIKMQSYWCHEVINAECSRDRNLSVFLSFLAQTSTASLLTHGGKKTPQQGHRAPKLIMHKKAWVRRVDMQMSLFYQTQFLCSYFVNIKATLGLGFKRMNQKYILVSHENNIFS